MTDVDREAMRRELQALDIRLQALSEVHLAMVKRPGYALTPDLARQMLQEVLDARLHGLAIARTLGIAFAPAAPSSPQVQ